MFCVASFSSNQTQALCSQKNHMLRKMIRPRNKKYTTPMTKQTENALIHRVRRGVAAKMTKIKTCHSSKKHRVYSYKSANLSCHISFLDLSTPGYLATVLAIAVSLPFMGFFLIDVGMRRRKNIGMICMKGVCVWCFGLCHVSCARDVQKQHKNFRSSTSFGTTELPNIALTVPLYSLRPLCSKIYSLHSFNETIHIYNSICFRSLSQTQLLVKNISALVSVTDPVLGRSNLESR